jgi:predicted flap endonuclease-1-like 5' DNA nuclease
MTVVLGLALMALGLVVGIIVAWAFKVGATTGLFVGILLVVAGAVIGFVVEWLIDEAYRKNRELRRQMVGRTDVRQALDTGGEGEGVQDTASQALADFLRQRDEELRKMRERLEASDDKLNALQDEFDSYQQTHPDDLTVIKGIGSVYQWKLRDAGFSTLKQLSTADPDKLRRMLDVKNWQRVNVESWIEQARDWAQRER